MMRQALLGPAITGLATAALVVILRSAPETSAAIPTWLLAILAFVVSGGFAAITRRL